MDATLAFVLSNLAEPETCAACGDDRHPTLPSVCMHGHKIRVHESCLSRRAGHCMGCAALVCAVCGDFGGEGLTSCSRGHPAPCHAECTGITAVYCDACEGDQEEAGGIEFGPQVRELDDPVCLIEYLDRAPKREAWLNARTDAEKCAAIRVIIRAITQSESPLSSLIAMNRAHKLPVNSLTRIMGRRFTGDPEDVLRYTLRYVYG